MKGIANRRDVVPGIVLMAALVSFFVWKYPVPVVSATGNDSMVKCRVELDKTVLPAESPQRAIVKVTLDAAEPIERAGRPAVNLAIVLDRSGSMSGPKIEKAKDAAIAALRRLAPGDVFSVTIYDHNVETIVPAQNAVNVEWIERRIRQIGPGGNTALFGGVSQGAAEVRKHLGGEYVHRIILLSDGLANVGPSNPEDLGRLGAALVKEEISVTTIGVGTDYNEDLMARLSQNSDGNTYFVESSVDLPRIFSAELGDVLNVVAKKVRIVIECPEGVRPLTIIGRDGRMKGRTVELSLNQLYGGQEKYALVEVEIAAGKSGHDMEVASAHVSYDNPFTKKRESSSGKIRARFSKSSAEVKKSANVGVQKEYQLNLKALAEEKAIDLSDTGKRDEAVEVLKQSAEKLKEFGNIYKDESILEEAEQMEDKAEQINKEGMTKKYRKELRTKSYQMKNQQSSE